MPSILTVDDSSEFLEVFDLILSSYSFDNKVLHSGTDLYAYLQTAIPDIIFLDVMLASEDGREICRQLKEDERYSAINVILMSASPLKLKGYQHCHADDILEKPFDLPVLIQKIKAMTDVQPQAAVAGLHRYYGN